MQRLQTLAKSLVAALLVSGAVLPLRAQFINLGAAADFVGLELGGSSFSYDISKATTEIYGNVGIAPNGNFSFTGGSVIAGTIYAGAGANLTITGGSGATGGVVQPSSWVTQAVADAHAAASYYSSLTPTQTLASLGADTFVGSGGTNVFDVTGSFNLARDGVLTLSGSSSDVFVFNIYGGNNVLGKDSSIQLLGISPSQVLFNLIGSGTQLTTTGHANTQGIFLAENGAIDIQGGVHNSDFIAGGSLTWQSGVNITQATTYTVQPVPELGEIAMSVGAVGLLGALVWRRERRSRKISVAPQAA